MKKFTLAALSIVLIFSVMQTSASVGYKMVVACTSNGHTDTAYICLEDTELKIRTDQKTRIYTGIDILQVEETARGIIFYLSEEFEITAQNSDNSWNLEITIEREDTGELVFHDIATDWGVIRVTNKGLKPVNLVDEEHYEMYVLCSMRERAFEAYYCFDETNLKIRSNGRVTIVTQNDMAERRWETGSKENGLRFSLSSRFEVTAQNGSDGMVLEIYIKDKSGRQVYQEAVGYYDVIKVAN